MKKCTICKKSKPAEEFSIRKDWGTLTSQCKECDRVRYRLYRKQNRQKISQKEVLRKKKLKELYPEKIVARNKVASAVRYGKLSKESCQLCKALKVEAHHPDYSKPLKVIWLCNLCHKKVHKMVSSSGTAYYRLTPEFKKFLEKCQEKNDIIGFEWDGSFNFGVILKGREED